MHFEMKKLISSKLMLKISIKIRMAQTNQLNSLIKWIKEALSINILLCFLEETKDAQNKEKKWKEFNHIDQLILLYYKNPFKLY